MKVGLGINAAVRDVAGPSSSRYAERCTSSVHIDKRGREVQSWDHAIWDLDLGLVERSAVDSNQ